MLAKDIHGVTRMKIIDCCVEWMASEPVMNKHSLFWGVLCVFMGLSFILAAILFALFPRFSDDPYSAYALLSALAGAFWFLVGIRLLEKWIARLRERLKQR